MDVLFEQVVNGLGLGGQYALWAVGYGMVYQILGLMHFAHGDTVVLAAFIAFSLTVAGFPFVIAAAAAIAAGAGIAILIERSVYRPLVERQHMFMAFMGAMAAAFILRNVVTLVWGVDTKVFEANLVPDFSVRFGGVEVRALPLVSLVLALLFVWAFEVFLNRSRTGMAIQAVAQDRVMAEHLGIRSNRIVALVYGLSGGIGVLGVLLYLADTQALSVSMGFTITLKAFVAAILGGIASIRGAVLGGVLLGLAEALIAGFVTTVMLNAIVFGLLGLVLLFLPNGLLGRRLLVKL